MAKNSYKSFFEPTLLYGGIVGGVLMVHSIILYSLDAMFSTYAQVAGIVLPILLYVYVIYSYRQEYLGGFMKYSRGLGMGTMFALVAGIILMLYTLVLVKLIDPNYLDVVNQFAIDKQVEKMQQRGLDDDVIERAIEMSSWTRTLTFNIISQVVGSIFMGAIFSAIISIFLKKENKEPFAGVEA